MHFHKVQGAPILNGYISTKEKDFHMRVSAMNSWKTPVLGVFHEFLAKLIFKSKNIDF